MVTDGNYAYRSERFVMYINVESLFGTPEIHMSYVDSVLVRIIFFKKIMFILSTTRVPGT